MVAETSMCSLPTMKFKAPAAPGWPGPACVLGVGVGLAPLSRAGPLSFSLCTYSVRMINNCPLDAAISFNTLRAAAGAALNVTATTLRSINVGTGVLPGLAVAKLWPTAGVGDALPSSVKGARCNDDTLSTFES